LVHTNPWWNCSNPRTHSTRVQLVCAGSHLPYVGQGRMKPESLWTNPPCGVRATSLARRYLHLCEGPPITPNYAPLTQDGVYFRIDHTLDGNQKVEPILQLSSGFYELDSFTPFLLYECHSNSGSALTIKFRWTHKAPWI